MVLFGATLVALGGMSLIDAMQTEGSLEQAETSMQQADSDLRELSFSADENRTSLKTSGDARLTQDARITLVVNGNYSDRSTNVTLGSLRYEADNGQTVSLEGGGVFRSVENGSVVVSRPSLTLRDGRLSFPVTKLDGSVDDGDSLTAKKNASNTRSLGSEILGDEHAPADNVTIIVESQHYDAWGRYLSRQTGNDPTMDHDAERASVTYNLSTNASDDSDAESTPEFDAGFVDYDRPDDDEYVVSGPTARVPIEVSNDGAKGDTTVALWAEPDQLLGVEDVSVDENGTERAVVEFPAARVGTGVHDLRVEVDGDETTGADLNVTTVTGGGSTGEPSYDVDIDERVYGVTEGETRTIGATVDNTGSADGDTSAALLVDGRLVAVEDSVSIPAGGSERLSFEAPSEPLDRGDHSVEVVVGDASDTAVLRVHALVRAVDDTPGEDTRHVVQHTVDDGSALDGESLDDITIDYPTGSVDASAFADPGNQIEAIGIDTDADGDIEDDVPPGAIHPNNGVTITDGASTVTIDLRHSNPTLRAGDRLVIEYDKDDEIVNPSVDGSYATTVTLDGVELTGDLEIGDADGDEECVTRLGAACGTIEEDESANAVRVNQDEASLTFVGSEIAQEIDKSEVERTPLDVVFTLDRSGSMDIEYYWHTMGTGDNTYYYPETETITVEEAIDEGYLTDSERDFGGWDDPETYDYTVTERGVLPYVREDGNWTSIDRTDGMRYTFSDHIWTVTEDGWTPIPRQIHFDADPEDEIQIRNAGFDPAEQRVDATRSFIDALNGSAGDRAAITEFESDANTIQELTDPATARSEVEASADGGTNITAGIRNAIDEHDADDNGEKAIVLLTDGENDVAGASTEDENDRTREAAEAAAAKDIAVYTVGLGNADRALLEDVANTTGGEFYPADEADELERVFDQIAGETVRDRTKQIEYQSATTAVRVGGESYTLSPDGDLGGSTPDKNASNVNDPTAGPRTYNVDDIDLGSLVSTSVAAYDCEESEGTDETVTHDGEEYERTRCVAADDRRDQRDNASVSHHRIYTDGDDLEEFDDLAWYQDGPEALLESYDGSLIRNGTFTLSDNQAVILVELDGEGAGTDYALMLLETREPDVDSTAEFDVSVDDVPDEVEQGDVAAVTATVENVDDTAGTVGSGVQIEGEMRTARELSTLSVGEEREVTYNVPTAGVDPGNRTLTVRAGDAAASDELTVTPPGTASAPSFDVSFDVPASGYEANESSTTVTAEIENTGTTDWETNAGLFVDSTGQIVGADSGIEVDAGETERVDFTVDPRDFESDGDYTVEVAVEDSSATAPLSVTKRPEQDPSVIDAPVDEIELEG
ncbi:hypothetical protein GCM10009020_31550 [Natronoarchaeum mannanilyticum]|uniref:VWFA domain-containing protein n=2 Tax=Natronoarchaeum mannanilyticum TaxID=926360 RepID=A0AAV3TCI6_9EURY